MSSDFKNLNLYPLTIVRDRYTGCYSGGKFTAWNLYPEDISEEIYADDVGCSSFFSHTKIIYGRGETPNDAFMDLINMLEKEKRL
jgi:hypothetical protein